MSRLQKEWNNLVNELRDAEKQFLVITSFTPATVKEWNNKFDTINSKMDRIRDKVASSYTARQRKVLYA